MRRKRTYVPRVATDEYLEYVRQQVEATTTGAKHGDGKADHDGDDHAHEGTGTGEAYVPVSLSDPFTRSEPLTEPLIGWKGLRVSPRGIVMSSTTMMRGLGPGSVGGALCWPKREKMIATCLDHTPSYLTMGSRPVGASHPAPGLSCNCGIHAAIELDRAIGYADGGDGFCAVIAEIYLWGRTVINETGYRAEFAYPRCLWIATGDERLVARCAFAYGVPAYAMSWDDMLDWSLISQFGDMS